VPGSVTPPADVRGLPRLSRATTCVALDLETTGLQVENESIIEVAAVKFRGPQVLDTFQTLVSPGRPVPYRIKRLTGLTDASLAGAPTFPELVDTLQRFISNWPLVGHSIAFDVSFLRRYGLARTNPLLDTFELANVLLPALPSYSLESVAAALAVPGTTYHRAMADAMLAKDVYLALLELLAQEKTSAIQAVVALEARHTWPLLELFRQELRHRGVRGNRHAEDTIGAQLASKFGIDPAVFDLPLASGSPGHVWPGANLASRAALPEAAGGEPGQDFLALDAPLADGATPDGPAQLVRSALQQQGRLLLETGVQAQETLGVLALALRWVADTHESLIIACNTMAACQRLAQQVLPALQQMLGTKLAVTIADDPENYICLHRWLGVARDRHNGELPADMARGLAKIALWLHGTQTGRRDELVLMPQEMGVWEWVCAGYHGMVAQCPYRAQGFCFVERARQHARQARIIVTTHRALIRALDISSRFAHPLSDQLAGPSAVRASPARPQSPDHVSEPVIPTTAPVLCLDGHLLEEAIFQETSFDISDALLRNLVGAISTVAPNGQRQGFLHLLEEGLQGGALVGERVYREFVQKRAPWLRELDSTMQASVHFFSTLDALVIDYRTHNSSGAHNRGADGYDAAIRLTDSVRSSEAWAHVQVAWGALHAALLRSAHIAQEIAAFSDRVSATLRPARAYALTQELLGVRERLLRLAAQGLEVVQQPSPERVYWLKPVPQPVHMPAALLRLSRDRQAGSNDEPTPAFPSLHGALVHAAPVLRATLFQKGRAVVLSAPTLAVEGEFTYVRERLGLVESAVPACSVAPVRHDQTLLYLPDDVPEPSMPQYQRHLFDAIVALSVALGGQVVVLFTSHAALRSAYLEIKSVLEQRDILVLAQGIDGSPRQLWQQYYAQERVVLFGAGSFWEAAEMGGPGPACTVVTRLPLVPLSDPAMAARAEYYQDQFNQFVIPQAALRLRQALNCLAWNTSRRNAVVLFDKRIQVKEYGTVFLNTLPSCTVHRGSVSLMPEYIERWLARLSPATEG
jgi:DNA polymerase III epsilon subunit family exonuclease